RGEAHRRVSQASARFHPGPSEGGYALSNLHDHALRAGVERGSRKCPAPFQAPRASVWQDGDLLIRVAQTDPKRFDHFLLEVRDVRTNSTLWQSEFNKRRPRFFYLRSGKTLTFVVGDYDEMKEAARQDSALSARIDAIKRRRDKEDSYLLQVYE